MATVVYTLPVQGDVPVPAQLARAERLYGKDIWFRGDKSLAANADYVTVKEVRNLRLAIYRRLAAAPGSYALRPTYGAGLIDAVKEPLNQSTIRSLEARVRDQLREERRIQTVEEVVVEKATLGGQAVVRVYIKVTAFGRRLEFQPFDFAREPIRVAA